MENMSENYSHIKGWGIDADPENEPTYPMKHYTGDDHRRLNYERVQQQPVTVEILKSNERPNITAVFGTSTPPSGFSGQIRRYAFSHSEGSLLHWLPLVLADRVNMIEAFIEDLGKGHIPNIIKERGWTAEWKYNKKGVIRNAIIGTAVLAALTVVLARRKKMSYRN